MAARETAIVFGVGPGLGLALAKRFTTENRQVGAVARDEAKLDSLIKSEGSQGIRPYAADVSSSEDVLRVFESVDRDRRLTGPRLRSSRRRARQAARGIREPEVRGERRFRMRPTRKSAERPQQACWWTSMFISPPIQVGPPPSAALGMARHRAFGRDSSRRSSSELFMIYPRIRNRPRANLPRPG